MCVAQLLFVPLGVNDLISVIERLRLPTVASPLVPSICQFLHSFARDRCGYHRILWLNSDGRNTFMLRVVTPSTPAYIFRSQRQMGPDGRAGFPVDPASSFPHIAFEPPKLLFGDLATVFLFMLLQ